MTRLNYDLAKLRLMKRTNERIKAGKPRISLRIREQRCGVESAARVLYVSLRDGVRPKFLSCQRTKARSHRVILHFLQGNRESRRALESTAREQAAFTRLAGARTSGAACLPLYYAKLMHYSSAPPYVRRRCFACSRI